MFEFKFFNPQLGSITVSVADYGLTFSRAAVEVLGTPEYVALGFDSENKIIGIVPTNSENPNKIEFKAKLKNGYVRINTRDFIRFMMKYFPDEPQMFGSKVTRYFSYLDDDTGYLIVDLKRPLDINDENINDKNETFETNE